MENKDKPTQSDTNHKMLFNSDGFELFRKILSVSVKFLSFVFIALLYVLQCILSQKSKSSDDYDFECECSDDNFVSTDITDIDARIKGKGYYK